jgi:GT2 family glycosyltransferase
MQAATGDAFVFCEADDEVAPGWLAAMGRALRKYEFVAGAHEYRRLNEPWLAKGMEPDRGLLWKKHMSPYPYSSGCKIGMRRSVYETVGRFDSDCKTSWDTDYCWRVQQAGIPLHFIPDAVISYRLTHKFVDRYRKGKLWGECDIILLKKHGNSSVGIRKIKTLILKGIQILLHLLKIPFFVWDKRAFGDWIWQLGWRIGEWRGYFKYLFLDRPIQQTRTAKTLKKSEGKALV